MALPVIRRRVTGHEEEDISLCRCEDAAPVTKNLQVVHDIQRTSLMDQASV